MAPLFDVLIIVLIVVSPFLLLLLPLVARIGPRYRIAAGVASIGIGLLLAVVFYFSGLIDSETHETLVYFIEFISLVLLPISVILFVAGPILYIALGIYIFVNKQLTTPLSLGIAAVVLLGICALFAMFWSLLA